MYEKDDQNSKTDACLFPVFSQSKMQSYFQGIGDLNLAYQCFKLTLINNNDYAEAYNNLAVLEMQKGHIEQVGVENVAKQNASSGLLILEDFRKVGGSFHLKWVCCVTLQLAV